MYARMYLKMHIWSELIMEKEKKVDVYIHAMNVLIYKCVWKSVHGGIEKHKNESSKECNFYTQFISKHHYQKVMEGNYYDFDKVNDLYKEGLINSGIPKDVLSAQKLVIESRSIIDDVEEVYGYVKRYIREKQSGKNTDRKIQKYEAKLMKYIYKQKQAYLATGIGCNEKNLRLLFRYLINEEQEAVDYELTQLERVLNGITFDTLMRNLNNENRLQKHKELIQAYSLKLQAILILKDNL
jgi:hypothetical protein